MTVNDVLTLTKAGFTKDEIYRLANIENPANSSGDTPAASGAPAPAPAPATSGIKDSPAPAPAPATPANTADNPNNYVTMDELAELIKTIRMDNINILGGVAPADAPTVDDMIATIINPFDNKEVK